MLPLTLISAFGLLALLHIYWLFGGGVGAAVAVPEVAGGPAFRPSRLATFMVAAGLVGGAVLVAALAEWLVLPVSNGILDRLGFGLAMLFALRAIGDLRLVGFFKRVRGTRFATYDSYLYSPLCLAIALGVVWVVLARQA